MAMILNCCYRSADAGMYRAADKGRRLADLLSDFYRVSCLHDRIRRSTRMHRQRNYDFFRIRESLKRQVFCEFFALRRMHAAVIAVEAVLPDGFYVIVYKFEINF